MKAAPTEYKEKCLQMTSSANLHYSEEPQNVLMLVIHLRNTVGQLDESYMNRQFTLKFLGDITVARCES